MSVICRRWIAQFGISPMVYPGVINGRCMVLTQGRMASNNSLACCVLRQARLTFCLYQQQQRTLYNQHNNSCGGIGNLQWRSQHTLLHSASPTVLRVRSTSDDSRFTSNDNSQTVGRLDGKMCIVFTCKVCQTRSSKLFSKHSYEKGVVIIQCPGCKNNHLIADNLGWFNHIQERNIEQIMASKGEKVKKSEDGEGTVEITIEDIIGSAAMKKITDGDK